MKALGKEWLIGLQLLHSFSETIKKFKSCGTQIICTNSASPSKSNATILNPLPHETSGLQWRHYLLQSSMWYLQRQPRAVLTLFQNRLKFGEPENMGVGSSADSSLWFWANYIIWASYLMRRLCEKQRSAWNFPQCQNLLRSSLQDMLVSRAAICQAILLSWSLGQGEDDLFYFNLNN